ncbi:hypothetical protein Mal4_04370 [Maioricimonas rarisocia]|uniref:Zinc finger/thioredoxin putative domain-containing protein n=2 Tax=Maioricimonas rarisocia TaxID=2528026 RepID=A0A517Z0Z9_9PLAN|nr:hypothetical protein Mal4_04370 [Maioricimonas rarisocia]
MSATISAKCSHCQASLKLKDRSAVGRKARCPKCSRTFVIALPDEATATAGEDDDFLEGLDELTSEPIQEKPPIVTGGRRKKPAKKTTAPEPKQRSAIASFFSALLWINAHIAAAICVVDVALDAMYVLANWDQAVIGRFAIRQFGRLIFLAIFTLAAWYSLILPRDIGRRGAVFVTGGIYLFLFGVVGFAMGAMLTSVYERPISAVQWSAVWFGLSLILYGLGGFPHETARERAERLMASGRFDEALTALEEAMKETPGDDELFQMKQSIRDMMRYA